MRNLEASGIVIGLNRFLLIIITIIGLLLPFTTYAQTPPKVMWDAPEGTLGWCTAVWGTETVFAEECYRDPIESCYAQYSSFASEAYFEGATQYGGYWDIYKCSWTTDLVVPHPSTIYFKCVLGFTAIFPGVCVKESYAYQTDMWCEPAPKTCNPIDILTGAKSFKANDYATTDGSISLDRYYVSLPYGKMPDSIVANNASLANWRLFFDTQLQIIRASGKFAVLHADGTSRWFFKDTDGSLKPLGRDGQTDQDASLKLIGTWPANLNTLTSVSSTWEYRDKHDTIWTFKSTPHPMDGSTLVAKPISMKDASGRILSFAYDQYGALSTMTDQWGKTISFVWNYTDTYDGSKVPTKIAMNIAQVNLPGGHFIRYHYIDYGD